MRGVGIGLRLSSFSIHFHDGPELNLNLRPFRNLRDCCWLFLVGFYFGEYLTTGDDETIRYESKFLKGKKSMSSGTTIAASSWSI